MVIVTRAGIGAQGVPGGHGAGTLVITRSVCPAATAWNSQPFGPGMFILSIGVSAVRMDES